MNWNDYAFNDPKAWLDFTTFLLFFGVPILIGQYVIVPIIWWCHTIKKLLIEIRDLLKKIKLKQTTE